MTHIISNQTSMRPGPMLCHLAVVAFLLCSFVAFAPHSARAAVQNTKATISNENGKLSLQSGDGQDVCINSNVCVSPAGTLTVGGVEVGGGGGGGTLPSTSAALKLRLEADELTAAPTASSPQWPDTSGNAFHGTMLFPPNITMCGPTFVSRADLDGGAIITLRGTHFDQSAAVRFGLWSVTDGEPTAQDLPCSCSSVLGTVDPSGQGVSLACTLPTSCGTNAAANYAFVVQLADGIISPALNCTFLEYTAFNDANWNYEYPVIESIAFFDSYDLDNYPVYLTGQYIPTTTFGVNFGLVGDNVFPTGDGAPAGSWYSGGIESGVMMAINGRNLINQPYGQSPWTGSIYAAVPYCPEPCSEGLRSLMYLPNPLNCNDAGQPNSFQTNYGPTISTLQSDFTSYFECAVPNWNQLTTGLTDDVLAMLNTAGPVHFYAVTTGVALDFTPLRSQSPLYSRGVWLAGQTIPASVLPPPLPAPTVPLLVANAMNGHKALRFLGAASGAVLIPDEVLAPTQQQPGPSTGIVVLRRDDTDISMSFAQRARATPSSHARFAVGPWDFGMRTDTVANTYSRSVMDGAWSQDNIVIDSFGCEERLLVSSNAQYQAKQIYVIRNDGAGTVQAFVNGDASPPVACTPHWRSAAVVGGILDRVRANNIYGDASDYTFRGDIAEVLVYDAALSDAEVMEITDYLRAKYRI